MLRGTSLQQPNSLVTQWLLIVFITVWLSACAPIPLSVDPTPLPECPPPSYNVNIYNSTPLPTVPSTVLPLIASNTLQVEQPDLSRKQIAFQKLEREVARWSDTKTFELGDTSQARITVTFLSPEVLRAAAVIDLLDENPNAPYIDAQAASMLEQIARREKLIFFLTAFHVKPNGETVNMHTLDIDAAKLILVNASGLQIEPAYYDHNLDQPIALPQYTNGYLYYPLAVKNEKSCIEVLNSEFNTKIILQLPSIIIDGKSTGPHTWTIQYTYLLNTGNSSYEVGDQYIPVDSEIQSQDTPPTSAEISDAFWEQYAKFIWAKLTPAHE